MKIKKEMRQGSRILKQCINEAFSSCRLNSLLNLHRNSINVLF